MPKQPIKLAIVDWVFKVNESNFDSCEIVEFLRKHLGAKYEFALSKSPKYVLYGAFGDSHLDFDESCIRIFITGENLRTDFNIADYGIDYDLLCFGGRHLHYPLYFSYKDDLRFALKKHLIRDRREKFCAFMVSNGGADKMRDEFFGRLCEYRRVDSGGAWKNNIGGIIGDRWGDFPASKRAWLKDYKFHLCFENSAHKGYVTEKLIQAFAAGCVPIYWGDSSLCDERYANLRPAFNPKAFINVHNFDSIDAAISEIQRIDSDESAFESMRKEPIFTAKSLEKFMDSGVVLDSKDLTNGNFANGGGQNGSNIWRNDIWSAEHIDKTAESVLNRIDFILARFYDNIFARGEKQITYGQHLHLYFMQRRLDRKRRFWRERCAKILWEIRCIAIAPLKKLRALWRKIAWRFLKS